MHKKLFKQKPMHILFIFQNLPVITINYVTINILLSSNYVIHANKFINQFYSLIAKIMFSISSGFGANSVYTNNTGSFCTPSKYTFFIIKHINLIV